MNQCFVSRVDDVLSKFHSLSDNPETFLKNEKTNETEFVSLTKSLYDLSKSDVIANRCLNDIRSSALKELYLDGFGTDEVWNQIELENEPFVNSFVKKVSKFISRNKLCAVAESDNDERNGVTVDDVLGKDYDVKSVATDEEIENQAKKDKKVTFESDEEESGEEERDNENFEDESVDETADFLGKDSKFESDDDESDGEMVEDVLGKGSDVKSSYEQQQKKLQKKIEKLEENNLSEKPWQLKGEITGEKRPENSLLEEHVEFDHTSRQAPLITEETTKSLEQIIKQRIKDLLWDDVERKQKQVQKPFEYRQRLVLDQEKSKASLSTIYEQEYLKKQKDEKAEEENQEHKEIMQMMRRLFAQLDALSNFSFTPKPPEPEVKIINNLPAVTVEEITPVIVSDAALLAPEEVSDKKKGELMANSEKTDTDKKRERRHKKVMQRLKYKHLELKKKTQTGNKYTKLEANKTLTNAKQSKHEDVHLKNVLKSSKAFFAKLQDQTRNSELIKKKKTDKIVSSKRLKL